MTGVEKSTTARELMAALDAYRPARQKFLAEVGVPTSNRDPLSEFSERLVHALMGGALAQSRVQAGHDLVLADGQRVQVLALGGDGAVGRQVAGTDA